MTAPIRIIVIDDHEAFIDSIRQMVKLPNNADIQLVRGVRVDDKMPDEEVLRAVQDEKCDVVVVDMRMRKDNDAGLRLVQLIGQQPGAPKLLAISGEVRFPEKIVRTLKSGARDYVMKDTASMGAILQAVRNVYHGQRSIPPEAFDYAVGGTPGRDRLTEKEKELWRMIADGKSNNEIAVAWHSTSNAVKQRVKTLYEKIGVNTRAQATRLWLEMEYGLREMDVDSTGA